MKYAVIACTADNKDLLVGYGYRTVAEFERAVVDRVRYHELGSSILSGIVVIRSDGAMIKYLQFGDKFELQSVEDEEELSLWRAEEPMSEDDQIAGRHAYLMGDG